MNEFYVKKQAKYKKEMDGYLKVIAPELEKELGKPYGEILEESWVYYRTQLLENFPYIGGDDVSGTKNLTGAYQYVALGAVCQKYGMTLERWGELSVLSYQRFYAKMPGFMRKIMGIMFTTPALTTKMLKKKDAKNDANAKQYPGSFETETQTPTAEYPIIYHTTVCPLALFAEKYGYTEYMPYLCNLDYAMFGALGVPLYRTKTCADGDGCCDFKIKPGAPVTPAWPCHACIPGDPLK